MIMWYWSVAILFWQMSIDHFVNVQYTRCGPAKTRVRHPSLPFDSLPYSTLKICRRVRTYARWITWQPNEKRLTIFYEHGALSQARFARVGAPLKSFPNFLLFFQFLFYLLGELIVRWASNFVERRIQMSHELRIAFQGKGSCKGPYNLTLT